MYIYIHIYIYILNQDTPAHKYICERVCVYINMYILDVRKKKKRPHHNDSGSYRSNF